jgi:nucleoside-diphosphate-sugar epimerase
MTGIKIMNCSKKVILTGATGLIGKEALEPLKKSGFEIYALTIDKENPNCGIHWLPCNLFDSDSIRRVFNEIKPSHLLNFAWAATGDYLTSNINFDFLKAGLNLLKYFNENCGKRAVFAGTCFEYEFKDSPLNEEDKINPQTVYAKCKNYLREISQLYCKQNDINFGWGRIFYVFGHNENEKRLTPHIINSLQNNKEVIINNGSLVRDYMYTKDIAGAFVKFLDSDAEGIVNICTGTGISLADYALKIAEKLGKKHLIKILNEPTMQPKIIIGNNNRLIKEVGYTQIYSYEKAIENILNTYFSDIRTLKSN